MTDNRQSAIDNLKHPLNRAFLRQMLSLLSPRGIYAYPAAGEVFTREELVQILEDAEKEPRCSSSR